MLNNVAFLRTTTNTVEQHSVEKLPKIPSEETRQPTAKTENNAVCQPHVAMTLSNLAKLYRTTQRFKPAEQNYQQALKLYRQLAEKEPLIYRSYIAQTLNDLAALYLDIRQDTLAEKSCQEALALYHQLAEQHSVAYQPYIAHTLHNLGSVYSHLGRFEQAEKAIKKH